MTLTKSLRQLALEDLGSQVCACGQRKASGKSFCTECYYALPPKLRRDMYLGINDGYAEAWSEAKDFLRIEAGRIA